MRYTITRQRLAVVGSIWQPGVTAAQVHDLTPLDLEHIGNLKDREAVARWIDTHCGDFSAVRDFRADFHIGDEHVIHEWENDESELIFNDCMYPEECA